VNLPAWLKPMEPPDGYSNHWGVADDGSIWCGGTTDWESERQLPFWSEQIGCGRSMGRPMYESRALRCECGSRAFELRSGEYKTTGICVQCGAIEVVHEG
jgi:hypothetical protein